MLIVGGSLAGLTAGAFLGLHGVRSLVVDTWRRPFLGAGSRHRRSELPPRLAAPGPTAPAVSAAPATSAAPAAPRH